MSELVKELLVIWRVGNNTNEHSTREDLDEAVEKMMDMLDELINKY